MNVTLPVQDPLKTPPVHNHYPGLYKGEIVQRIDPDRLGRVRVRVEGIHTGISVESLPWAWPCRDSWKKGGNFGVPPLNEYVWVMFEAGMADYPVWLGGWWGAPTASTPETADGRGASQHKELPTNNFGGKAWTSGILKKEAIQGLRDEDQPNNYTYGSPLQKHLEFDDRAGLEKLKIGDQLDNFLAFDTQRGRSTWELIQGLNGDVQNRKYRGVTLNNQDEVWQSYSFGGWKITQDDKLRFMELSSPGKFKVLMNEQTGRLEIWTANKHYLLMDDVSKQIILETAAGRQLVMDDTGSKAYFTGANKQNYLLLDDVAGTAELRCQGALNLKGLGAVSISSNGPISLDGSAVYLNCGAINVGKVLQELQKRGQPENAPMAVKAIAEQRGVIPQ